jgi:hypothetical protein
MLYIAQIAKPRMFRWRRKFSLGYGSRIPCAKPSMINYQPSNKIGIEANQENSPCGLQLNHGVRLESGALMPGKPALVAEDPRLADLVIHAMMRVTVDPQRHAAFLDKVVQRGNKGRVQDVAGILRRDGFFTGRKMRHHDRFFRRMFL